MKYNDVNEGVDASHDRLDWRKACLKPFLLGLAFGAGCYLAKVIINSPLMSKIVATTAEEVARKKKF